jgi:hypothetical protein
MAVPNKWWLGFSSLFIFLIFIFLTGLPLLNHGSTPASLGISNSTTTEATTFHAPRKNLWQDLNDSEVDDLLEFLYSSPNGLNLTRRGNATV